MEIEPVREIEWEEEEPRDWFVPTVVAVGALVTGFFVFLALVAALAFIAHTVVDVAEWGWGLQHG